MLTQARSSCSPGQPNQLRSVRAQVEKFVRLVQKKSIELSQENRRARVRDTDVYRAIWLVIGNKMPLDRVKKLSKGRGTVAKVHVRHERQRKEMKAGVMAVVAKELEALKSQKLGAPSEVDEQNMETDHSPQSEAAKSSNSVEMRSEESSGPSTSAAQGSAAQAATGTKTSSPDDVSVDMSPEKCESISIAEIPGEGHHGDAGDPNQNVDETLYEVKEPDSDSSASNLSGIVKEVVEMDEVSSKPLASLPEDDTATEKIDSESDWESEPRDSDEDSVDKLREYPTEVLTEDDTMKEVTEQLAETNIRPGKKITPKRAPNRSEEEMPAKVRPKSFGFSGTAIRPESLSLENSPMPSQRLRTQRRLSNLEPDAPGPSQDSTSSKLFHMSAPGPSREIPTPSVSIVVTPPEEDPEGPED